jgi:hypothetical protein
MIGHAVFARRCEKSAWEVRNSTIEARSKLVTDKKSYHGSCKLKKLWESGPMLRENENLSEESNVLVAMRDQSVRGEVRLVVDRT